MTMPDGAAPTSRPPSRPPSRKARLEAVLIRAFNPTRLEIEDDSSRHAGHAGAHDGGETHYTVTIISDNFTGLSRVERSRMVHDVLAQEFSTGLHALSMILRSPLEQKS